MIDVKRIVATSHCSNCGAAISRLSGRGGDYWAHDPKPGRGIYRRTCFASWTKFATPAEKEEDA